MLAMPLYSTSVHNIFRKTNGSNNTIDIHVPVDLLGFPVATEKTTQNPHAAHPAQLLWHTGIGSTLSLT